ncbi:MAG TPA: metallopeptidase TldD-related protein [Candidatus Kapabacteria bacterium]|nr:metallopeptidase TldD-related protein [Candidatus Kapabacteria bacterium]
MLNIRQTTRLFLPVLVFAGFAIPSISLAQQTGDNLIKVLHDELNREYAVLKAQPVAPYFISYNLGEDQNVTISASFGALERSTNTKNRTLLIDLRVGDYQLDNTHQIRGGGGIFGGGGFAAANSRQAPVENDPEAMKISLWRETDAAYKAAKERLEQVRTNKTVKVEEEDTSADFSKPVGDPAHLYEPPVSMDVFFKNRDAWEQKLRTYSAIFRDQPNIYEAKATLVVSIVRKYFVSTEGSEMASNQIYCRVMIQAMTKADDGMELPLYKSYFAATPEDLPSDAAVLADAKDMLETLQKMRVAPLVDPYTGPAILSGGASGVFFHEIFGHRVEGHRQKNENEGQTFKKKIGQQIMPKFLSVYFDPLLQKYAGTQLMGCFKFDDEGTKARRVDVVDDGIFKNFLMGRSPIEGFEESNGHGRSSPGKRPVARQSNLVVTASQSVPEDSLRRMLITECKKQGKPYGLYFQQVEGGFTLTGRTIPNSFNVLPILVYRVYADGRPDELVRGVDLIGTPLATFERILAASDKPETFNGICGAESGWVPVSASAPSLLVREIEVQKKEKSQERLPILSAPAENPSMKIN